MNFFCPMASCQSLPHTFLSVTKTSPRGHTCLGTNSFSLENNLGTSSKKSVAFKLLFLCEFWQQLTLRELLRTFSVIRFPCPAPGDCGWVSSHGFPQLPILWHVTTTLQGWSLVSFTYKELKNLSMTQAARVVLLQLITLVLQEVGEAQEYGLKYFTSQREKSLSAWKRRQFSCVVTGLIPSA